MYIQSIIRTVMRAIVSAEKASLSEKLRAARETARRTASNDKEKALHDKLIKVGMCLALVT